jgi:hypothetical protein
MDELVLVSLLRFTVLVLWLAVGFFSFSPFTCFQHTKKVCYRLCVVRAQLRPKVLFTPQNLKVLLFGRPFCP